ncbi:MAG: hypothetical protein QNI84_13450 [Henriciella sp.]|nr:hypothetical protein [Henriciella sp.]
MGLMLEYPDVTFAPGEGEVFYPEDGAKAAGTLMLYDWSNPACVLDGATSPAGAINLAADTLVATAGAGATFTYSHDAQLPFSPGRGVYKTSAQAGNDRSTFNASQEVRDYLYAGGIPADQPDILSIFWARFDPAGDLDLDLLLWAPSTKVPALLRFGVDNNQPYVQEREFLSPALFNSGADTLQQVAVSRDEIFVNGVKYDDMPPDSVEGYGEFLAGMGGASPINGLFYLLSGAVDGVDIPHVYRVVMEEPAASGRTALEAVQADFEYVMSGATFVDTV